MPTPTRTNWSGNQTWNATRLHTPATLQELQHLVLANKHIKALGTTHSFNPIADTPGAHISLRHFHSITLDREAQSVTVGAGVTYGRLAPWLHARGFALPNLASLPHISIAGAIATATHGSGLHNGNLSTAVQALQFIDGRAEHIHLSRIANPDRFPGAVVALGALGIVTSLTLRVQPTFHIAQTVYQNLPFAQLEHHLDPILSAAYSVSLFTDWQRVTQVWLKQKVEPGATITPPATFFTATLQTTNLHPLPHHSAEHCTPQQALPGPWFDRLPHFRLDFTPSSGNELQSEYFLPLEHAFPAILAIARLRHRIAPLLLISELRTIAADDLWLSMACRRPSLAIHFTWKPDWPSVRQILPLIEEALAPFHPRPHWAKLFTTPPAHLRTLYPRLPDFLALRHLHDPQGRFLNHFLTTHLPHKVDRQSELT